MQAKKGAIKLLFVNYDAEYLIYAANLKNITLMKELTLHFQKFQI